MVTRFLPPNSHTYRPRLLTICFGILRGKRPSNSAYTYMLNIWKDLNKKIFSLNVRQLVLVGHLIGRSTGYNPQNFRVRPVLRLGFPLELPPLGNLLNKAPPTVNLMIGEGFGSTLSDTMYIQMYIDLKIRGKISSNFY